jgi:glycosyltransferase involved in cell wall biosynthesis
MRVLAITNLFPNARQPNRGVFNLQQFAALSQCCDLRVVAPIAFQPWRDGWTRPVPYEEQWQDLPTRHPFFLYTPGFGRALHASLMYLSVRRSVLQVAREFQPDVLLAPWAYPDAVAAALLARKLRRPWVAEVLGSDINVMAAEPLRRAQIRWALRQASCTMAVSRALKERLVEIGVPGNTVRVLHNGVDVHRFQIADQAQARQSLALPLDRRIVLFVGNLLRSKGAGDLLEAARTLVVDRDSAPLVVLVGAGDDREWLDAHVQQYGLAEHVQLVGARPHAEIPRWIAAADLLCLPSHREGCPNVVLEALACGRPVVASAVGSVPDLIDVYCGAVVPPQAPEDLAAALRTVLSREWSATALRARVAGLTWEENARTLAGELQRAARLQPDEGGAGTGVPLTAAGAEETAPGVRLT